jgi:DNA polymerase-3 subunit epsilon
MIEMQQMKIPLNTAYHQIIRTDEPLKAENVIIHQITDDAKDAGEQLKQVVETLLERLAGKVMLAHYHPIEREFLKRACQLLYNTTITFPMIDTLHTQKKEWDKGLLPYDPSKLRLSNLRDHYALPHHKAHNALTDALATAELFQAQQSTYQFRTLNDVLLK